jgi:putative spermidine/putrescine transport system ATP-binding protein
MQLEVRRLHDRLGLTTVYVTHDQREALTMSDRIAVIDRGRIVQIDRPLELYEQPHTQFVADFIGETHVLPVRVHDGQASFFGRPLRLSRPLLSAAPNQVLALRPEKLRFLEGADGGDLNEIEGRIRQHVFQGDSQLTYVTVAEGREIAVRRSHAVDTARHAPGTPVRVGFSPADTIIVPALPDLPT